MGIGIDRHLIEIVGTAPLQGNEFLDEIAINMKHIFI